MTTYTDEQIKRFADAAETESRRPDIGIWKTTCEAMGLICRAWLAERKAAREGVTEVLIAVERPEGYEDVHPDLVAEDFAGDAEWRGWKYRLFAPMLRGEPK